MSDGYVVVDGKKVAGRRLSFDGDNLSVSSASPVDENPCIVDDEVLSEMASAGYSSSDFVSDSSEIDYVEDDEISAGHCFETPYGKIYVKSTEPVDVSLLGRTKDFVKKNAIPFGLGIVTGALCVGLYSMLKGKNED